MKMWKGGGTPFVKAEYPLPSWSTPQFPPVTICNTSREVVHLPQESDSLVNVVIVRADPALSVPGVDKPALEVLVQAHVLAHQVAGLPFLQALSH